MNNDRLENISVDNVGVKNLIPLAGEGYFIYSGTFTNKGKGFQGNENMAPCYQGCPDHCGECGCHRQCICTAADCDY